MAKKEPKTLKGNINKVMTGDGRKKAAADKNIENMDKSVKAFLSPKKKK